MEEKLLKVTLLGISESNGTFFTESFPPTRSKALSFLTEIKGLKIELIGSFGGAMGAKPQENIKAETLFFGQEREEYFCRCGNMQGREIYVYIESELEKKKKKKIIK